MKKGILIIIAVVVVLVVVGVMVFSNKKSEYIFETVSRKNITGMVSESGTVTTSGGVYIYSATTGIIDKVFVSNGDDVTEKQKLFSVKSTATPQEKTESYALYQSAKSAVKQAENTRRSTTATVDRVHDNVKNNDNDETFLEKETRTIAEVANDNAYDALLAAQANLISAQTKYNSLLNSTAIAPISGVVSNLAVISGSMVMAKSLLSPSDPILFIKSGGLTEILITIGENDINKIDVGQKADVKFDAIENKTYKGVVERFDEKGTVVQGVSKYNLYISIIDADEKIKSGMTADADIITSELTNVLAVPNTAIKPYQKGRAVRVLDDKGNIQYLPVKIGVRGKEFTQIIEGLKEGQKIIVSLTSEQTPKASMFKI
ncbi:MAG: efflux RND transporter periplasmic adaptor subunit [Candidatus Shapirobacteria bacterium]|nr:efflux RND transporter periplasmic adaptor subunit [Candidatus Shapirobacteria bacterium]